MVRLVTLCDFPIRAQRNEHGRSTVIHLEMFARLGLPSPRLNYAMGIHNRIPETANDAREPQKPSTGRYEKCLVERVSEGVVEPRSLSVFFLRRGRSNERRPLQQRYKGSSQPHLATDPGLDGAPGGAGLARGPLSEGHGLGGGRPPARLASLMLPFGSHRRSSIVGVGRVSQAQHRRSDQARRWVPGSSVPAGGRRKAGQIGLGG